MDASIVVGAVSIVLALVLFAMYRRIYAQNRSGFGIALLIFAGAFVVQSGLTVYSYLSAMPLIPTSFSPFLLGTGACEATGLAAMVWTASR